MAKNWKVGEAVRAIQAGNKEDILDIGRRFPLFAVLAGQTNEPGAKLLDAIPDYVTARKMESVLKGETEDSGEDADTDKEEEAPKEKEKEKKEEKKDAYAGKSAKELYKMCQDRKIECETKQAPEAYIKLLKKDDAAKAKAKDAKEKEKSSKKDDDWDEGETKKDAGKAGKEDKKEKKEKKDDDWDI